jgi:hypothetical protein
VTRGSGWVDAAGASGVAGLVAAETYHVDNLTIVVAKPTSAEFRLNAELIEARWVTVDLGELPADAPISRWLKLALAG